MSLDLSLYQGPMARLILGALAFREREYRGVKTQMAELAKRQTPEILLVGCCDSRVDLAHIGGADLGEIFTVRNVANLVPPYDYGGGSGHGVRAAIEYGVKELNVSHIVVFGHAHCGGIKAAIDNAAGHAHQSDFLGSWLAQAVDACHQEVVDPVSGESRPVAISLLKEYSYLVERASVLNSLQNLRGYPWIAERVAAGSLTLHGWWFDLETGDLWATHPHTGQFLPVEEL